MRDHTKLKAFHLADEVAVTTYRTTQKIPKEEVYGITAQMRRAAVSVPSNIVEECASESQAEYCRFLEIAFASLRELHYQVTLSKRLCDFRAFFFLLSTVYPSVISTAGSDLRLRYNQGGKISHIRSK